MLAPRPTAQQDRDAADPRAVCRSRALQSSMMRAMIDFLAAESAAITVRSSG
jgi:hypothetical protein